ncbi:MAG: class I SAM-dependent methyltransferase [Limisphaerales bacterium]
MPSPPPTLPPRLRLRVTATAEEIIRGGHPWLFESSIREQNRPGLTGELAVIFDRQDRFLAIGLFDPESPLRVRVLHRGKPVAIDEAWWSRRLQESVERRRDVAGPETDGYRLIHGESDGWPGLVLDRYGPALVLKLYTAAWLPRLDDVVRVIREALAPERMVLRLSRNIQELARTTFQRLEGEFLCGADREPVQEFRETGLRFEADLVRGQKTGFFLDQRENRRRVEGLARGGEVLNAFSFSGGFSLYAARGGATRVTDLDISAHALTASRRNFDLNQSDPALARCRHETVQTDVFTWLDGVAKPGFDVVVLDPPSLARKEIERSGAIQAYGRLATGGLRALRPGGVLVAASCSAHVSADEFFDVVRQSARRSGRSVAELETTGHPPDHPATFAEARYLKCIYLRA